METEGLVEGADQNGESRGVGEGVRSSHRCGRGESPVFPGVRRLEPPGTSRLCFSTDVAADRMSVRPEKAAVKQGE